MRRYSRERSKRKLITGLILLCIIFPFIIPIVVIIYFVKKSSKNNEQKITYRDLPYRKKSSQITSAEINFYKVLEQAVNGKFDIQRQVLLSTLVTTTSRFFTDYSTGRKYNPDRSKIDRLTIDFVLYHKEDLSPYLAIELDDKSHLQQDRVIRDNFVEQVLNETGIKLVRVKNAYSYSIEEITNLIN
jgi:hypothetical protein